MDISRRSFDLALIALLAASGPIQAAGLPDAVYRCQLYSGSMMMHLGDIEIAGTQYRGPAHDGNFEGWHPLQVTESGNIIWGGPLGGLSSGGNSVRDTVLTLDGTATAFDVTVQLPNGNLSTVSCLPQ